ncbi:MAG: hypothetical protein MSA09_01995 [Lachnospiraceae bacterium]|nr:hypothetical protein [Lachnospiraceae bacterium]
MGNTKVVVTEAVVDNTTKIASVKQDTFTDFTVTMSKALETATAADFSMVRDDDNQVITVKSASLDATDKTKVKLTVYTSLTDAKTYTVTYTAADEAKTQSSAKVTVTDGTVAAVNITPVEITANKATKIEYQTLDANGVIVSQKGVTKQESKVDVTWDSLLGTMDTDTSEYILYNVGDTAKFTVTYHTYKYDTTTGAELDVITKDFTVTAVKDASVITQYAYTVATSEPYDWAKVTPKQTIALNDEGAAQRTAYFQIKDSKGNDVTKSCEYTVESSDNSVVVADGTVKDGAPLNPVSKGSAYLMIKDGDGKVVSTLPITVGEKRTITTFKLSSPVLNVANTASTNAKETCVYSDITAKDQYGDDIALADLTYDNKTGNHTTAIDPKKDAKTICAYAGNGNKGSESYIIKATDSLGKSMTTSLRVNSIVPTDANPTFSVVFLDENNKVVSSVDTTVAEDANATDAPASKTLKVVVVEKKNGVVTGKTTDSTRGVRSVQVTKNDGTVIAKAVSDASVKITSSPAISDTVMLNGGVGVTGTAVSAVADAITITAREKSTGLSEKHLGVGTYTVVYELINGTKVEKAAASFNVKDTQTAVTAKVKETASSETTLSSVLVDSTGKYVEYYYGSVKVAPADVDFVGVKATYSNGNKNAYVTNVTVKVPVAGNANNKITVTVPVNKTFTTSAAGGWS